jgi:hypothetical protein
LISAAIQPLSPSFIGYVSYISLVSDTPFSPADREERRARILGDWTPSYPWTVISLRDHLYDRAMVWATCRERECRHRDALDLVTLAERLGPTTPLDAVVRRLRCKVCGADRPEISIGTEKGRPTPREQS